jgi:hypothetical protein
MRSFWPELLNELQMRLTVPQILNLAVGPQQTEVRHDNELGLHSFTEGIASQPVATRPEFLDYEALLRSRNPTSQLRDRVLDTVVTCFVSFLVGCSRREISAPFLAKYALNPGTM